MCNASQSGRCGLCTLRPNPEFIQAFYFLCVETFRDAKQMKLNKLLATAIVTAGVAMPQFAAADSDEAFGAGATASADLDFLINIEQFVFFRVGTDLAGSVDRVDWTITGTPGTSPAPIAATGGSRDGSDGILTIELRTNAATVTLASSTGGGVLNGPTDTIPFTDINVSDGGTITAPGFDGNTVIATAGVYAATDSWTYSYNDDTEYDPGQYTGTSTYTAATP